MADSWSLHFLRPPAWQILSRLGRIKKWLARCYRGQANWKCPGQWQFLGEYREKWGAEARTHSEPWANPEFGNSIPWKQENGQGRRIDIMTACSHNIKRPAALDRRRRKLRRFIAGKWKQIVCSVKEYYQSKLRIFLKSNETPRSFRKIRCRRPHHYVNNFSSPYGKSKHSEKAPASNFCPSSALSAKSRPEKLDRGGF